MTAVDTPGLPVADEVSAWDEEKGSIWLRIPRFISVPLFLALLVGVWHLAVTFEWVSQYVLPPPADVGRELWSMFDEIIRGGPVRDNLWITAQEAVLGFFVAAALGIGLGVLVAESTFGRQVVLPFLVGVNAAPKVAFAPIFVAWLGFGIEAKVALAAFIAFFPLLVDTAAGLASVDAEQHTLFTSLRASRAKRFVKLQLPASLPFVFAGLKTASVLAVVGAVVGEFLGGGEGLGQATSIAGNLLATDRVFGYAIILAIFGYVFYALIVLAERKIVFWQKPHHIQAAG
ncbi:MAG TPA: ABC transporter permease [Acidimicrobiales bacterium]|jgi:NitT/TauT family transport system permease protein|nr:ABC transporter permease [Acidimicrobiales bacterium]HKH24260.1 ABC transporter permease [Acidimicrobiales bacterium]